MFQEADIKQINERGSDLKAVGIQIENFKRGFPFLDINSAATPKDGIMVLADGEIEDLVNSYDRQAAKKQIVKFVPASGAASRMFKLLYSFLEIADNVTLTQEQLSKSEDLQSISTFFKRINDFAFYNELNDQLQRAGKSISSCLENKDYASILSTLLESDGMNYGSSPKGLLKFHKYEDNTRTPVMEHLAEGALYAKSENDKVKIHFTVSPEHHDRFNQHVQEVASQFEKQYSVTYDISFSEQKSYTDTIAVDLHNEPFRNQDGSLLFRPAGHGALIENLNEINADIVFIKNIDNVVPDSMKPDTVKFKKAIAGILLNIQTQIFRYLQLIDKGASSDQINEMMQFLEEKLKIKNIPVLSDQNTKIQFLRNKLNRPIRICGMVKNEGEPGGGPFYALNHDGTVSLQIAESSQVDFNNESQKTIANEATHFNPVDLVCGIKNYEGEKFDLTKYVDTNTGFISQKSKDGRELKAQELPGLWNGSMSDWNTLFLEVPISTFNPVKTVNDLLRPQHQ